MKVTIESTSEIVKLNGIDCRVWQGVTERGIKIQCLIPRIAARKDEELSQFEAELKETAAPSLEGTRMFPLRMIV